MPVELVLAATFAFLLLFLVSLGVYEYLSSGFKDKDKKIEEIVNFMGDKLSYNELKRRCPECDNIDYFKAKKYI